MALTIREANKGFSFLKIAIEGQDFSGKTYSSLLIATAIVKEMNGSVKCSDIVVISTEKDKVDIYDGVFTYSVIEIPKPYKPEDLIEAINICVNSNVLFVIIDSLTHFWTNIKDRVNDLVDGNGNALGIRGWGKKGEGTPLFTGMISTIKDSPIHLIATVRAKAKVGITKVDGHTVVYEKGILPDMRKEYGFEFLVKMRCIDQDMHLFTAQTRDSGNNNFNGSFIPDKTFALKLFDYVGRNDYGKMRETKIEELDKKKKVLSLYSSFIKKELEIETMISNVVCIEDYRESMDTELLNLAIKLVKDKMRNSDNLTNEGVMFLEKRRIKLMEAK